jgi:hypothetical protein
MLITKPRRLAIFRVLSENPASTGCGIATGVRDPNEHGD